METITCKRTKAVQSHRIMPNETNFYKNMYGGQLLYILDNIASVSASRMTEYGLMTGNMDSVNFLQPLPEGDIVHVETYVTGTGKRSLEVFAKVIGESRRGERYLAATGFLTFVVLKDYAKEGYVLPGIVPESDEEKFLCAGYLERKQQHQANRQLTEELIQHLTVELLD